MEDLNFETEYSILAFLLVVAGILLSLWIYVYMFRKIAWTSTKRKDFICYPKTDTGERTPKTGNKKTATSNQEEAA